MHNILYNIQIYVGYDKLNNNKSSTSIIDRLGYCKLMLKYSTMLPDIN